MIESPSPNYDERRLPVSIVVIHYTGMKTAAAAQARLRDPKAKVSAHYLIAEDGTVVRLVPEDKRAWHAGVGYWRGIRDVNSASIGIELANPGIEHGYVDFPEPQMLALEDLLAGILKRHDIDPRNVIGHSDLAPGRKVDPGELFPWERLAAAGLAQSRPMAGLDPNWSDKGMKVGLQRFGYEASNMKAALSAFQLRWRPGKVDGEIDAETRAILFQLLKAGAPEDFILGSDLPRI